MGLRSSATPVLRVPSESVSALVGRRVSPSASWPSNFGIWVSNNMLVPAVTPIGTTSSALRLLRFPDGSMMKYCNVSVTALLAHASSRLPYSPSVRMSTNLSVSPVRGDSVAPFWNTKCSFTFMTIITL